jgi:hypothetical protein
LAAKGKQRAKISFAAPTTGATPDGYKIRVKLKGGHWKTLREYLKTTSTIWKNPPKVGQRFQIKVASYKWGPNVSAASTTQVVWTTAKTMKVKK